MGVGCFRTALLCEMNSGMTNFPFLKVNEVCLVDFGLNFLTAESSNRAFTRNTLKTRFTLPN